MITVKINTLITFSACKHCGPQTDYNYIYKLFLQSLEFNLKSDQKFTNPIQILFCISILSRKRPE